MKFTYHTFSGDDPNLIRDSEVSQKLAFRLLQVTVILITLLCLISSYLLFSQTFSNKITGVAISFLFTTMILNIYRLMLCTSGKSTLPQPAIVGDVPFSWLLRPAFVCFLALIVAKPVESILYSDVLDTDLADYKNTIRQKGHEKIRSYYLKESSGNVVTELKLLNERKNSCAEAIRHHDTLLESSDFYIHRLRLLCSKHVSCWLITILITLLFLCPLFLKNIMLRGKYYDLRRLTDMRIVDLNYYAFNKKYNEKFKAEYQQTVHHFHAWQDVPYNTIRKKDTRVFYSEKELLSELYHD